MKEVACVCGERKRRFKNLDLEFYVDDCCEAKGYDYRGLKASEKVKKTLTELSKMNVGQLAELAKTWGIEGTHTKKEFKHLLWTEFNKE